MTYDLGYIDLEERTLQPLENPFGPPAAADHVLDKTSSSVEKSSTSQPSTMGGPGETEASNAGEQLAEGQPVRLIADDEQGLSRAPVFSRSVPTKSITSDR